MINFLRSLTVAASRKSALPLALLVSETLLLAMGLRALSVESNLLLWFFVVSSLTIFAFWASAAIYKSHSHLFTTEIDLIDFQRKQAETQANFLNGAFGAIIATAMAIYGLSYASRPQQTVNWSEIDLMSVEGAFPALDNRLADLKNQYSIFGPSPMKDVFPLFFPSTIRDSNEDVSLMNKVNFFANDNGFSTAIEGYISFIDIAGTYVEKAQELENASDRASSTFAPTKINELKKILLGIQQQVRERFFSFQSAYCSFINSKSFEHVKSTISNARKMDYRFRSNFCRSSQQRSYRQDDDANVLARTPPTPVKWWELKGK